jgi:hypothetical protein
VADNLDPDRESVTVLRSSRLSMMAGRLVSKTVDGLIWWLTNWDKVMGVVLGGFLLLMPVFIVMIILHIFFRNVLCPSSDSPLGCSISLLSSILQYAATAFKPRRHADGEKCLYNKRHVIRQYSLRPPASHGVGAPRPPVPGVRPSTGSGSGGRRVSGFGAPRARRRASALRLAQDRAAGVRC